MKAEVGQFFVFGAGVNGCNGLLSPTEYSGNGQVVLYMGEQGAIIFREQEGWRMNQPSSSTRSVSSPLALGLRRTRRRARHPQSVARRAPLAQRM